MTFKVKIQVDDTDKIKLDASFPETQFYIEGHQYSPFRRIVTVYNTVIWPKKKAKVKIILIWKDLIDKRLCFHHFMLGTHQKEMVCNLFLPITI